MNEIIYSQIFLLTLTVGVYLGAVQLRRRVNCALLHPILVSVAVLIAFVKLTGMPYEHYMRQTQIIDFLLGLSVAFRSRNRVLYQPGQSAPFLFVGDGVGCRRHIRPAVRPGVRAKQQDSQYDRSEFPHRTQSTL